MVKRNDPNYVRKLYLKWGWEYIRRALIFCPQHLPPGMGPIESITYNDVYTWKGEEGHSFGYEFPYNPIKRDEIIETLKRCGYCILNRKLEKGNDVIYMKHTNESCWIKLAFTFHKKGSTCKRVQIGSETITREEPIYEIVCGEGAEEAVF